MKKKWARSIEGWTGILFRYNPVYGICIADEEKKNETDTIFARIRHIHAMYSNTSYANWRINWTINGQLKSLCIASDILTDQHLKPTNLIQIFR